MSLPAHPNPAELHARTTPTHTRVQSFLRLVQLRVHSNAGHPNYTCLYRFRVHGRPESKPLPVSS